VIAKQCRLQKDDLNLTKKRFFVILNRPIEVTKKTSVLKFLRRVSVMPYENVPQFVDETPGMKTYCTCGESANKPYCDGAHSRMNTGKTPKTQEITEAKRVVICDCGRTSNSPFCDGTHSKK